MPESFKQKKILIFHPALAPYRIDQLNSLSELFELEVVFMFDNVWNHKFDQNQLLSQLKFKYSFLLKGPSYKGRVFRFNMLRTIRRSNPDVIIGYEYSLTTQYLVLLKRLGLIRQKIGSTIDDSIEICNNIQSKTRDLARRKTIKWLDFIVVLSHEVSSYYHESFDLLESKIIVSPILQKPERLRKERTALENIAYKHQQNYRLRDKKVLLFVGRFIAEKALIRFIESIGYAIKQIEDLKLVLVGEGAERGAIEAAIEKYDLKHQILLPGRFESFELYAWYLCASGFVLPSTYEPFGAVVNEALVFGLPVFCSRYAGASTILIDDRSMTFDPLDDADTNTKLNAFVARIDKVSTIDLSLRKSLSKDDHNEFIDQWNKL